MFWLHCSLSIHICNELLVLLINICKCTCKQYTHIFQHSVCVCVCAEFDKSPAHTQIYAQILELHGGEMSFAIQNKKPCNTNIMRMYKVAFKAL